MPFLKRQIRVQVGEISGGFIKGILVLRVGMRSGTIPAEQKGGLVLCLPQLRKPGRDKSSPHHLGWHLASYLAFVS